MIEILFQYSRMNKILRFFVFLQSGIRFDAILSHLITVIERNNYQNYV